MPSKKKLRERSDAKLGDIFNNPDAMFTPSDLAAAGMIRSYSGIKDWINKGWLPTPHQLPNGRKFWLGRELIDTTFKYRGQRDLPRT